MTDFICPVKNARLTSKFGWRNLGFGREWHQGIDLASTGKVPIYAAADGTVFRAGALSSYGNVVMIRHTINGKRMETNYAHLDSIRVKVGQKVKQGDIIGIMGNTGRSFGVHLHFEIHNPQYAPSQPHAVDPMKYIELDKDVDYLKRKEDELTMSQYNTLKNLIDAQAKEIDELKKQLNNKDTRESTWAKDAWKFGKDNGLSDGTRPKAYITREEVLTLFFRFFTKFIKK